MNRLKNFIVWINFMTSTDNDLHPGDGASITYYTA